VSQLEVEPWRCVVPRCRFTVTANGQTKPVTWKNSSLKNSGPPSQNYAVLIIGLQPQITRLLTSVLKIHVVGEKKILIIN